MVDVRLERERRKREETIRTMDEKNYIDATVREAYEEMPHTFGRWPTKSWCRTDEGKEARRRAVFLIEERRLDREISENEFLHGGGGGGGEMKVADIKNKNKDTATGGSATRAREIRALLVEMRLEMTREKARKYFRKRWAPKFCCSKCGVAFGVDGERHLCVT
jgi:hypothetical protein